MTVILYGTNNNVIKKAVVWRSSSPQITHLFIMLIQWYIAANQEAFFSCGAMLSYSKFVPAPVCHRPDTKQNNVLIPNPNEKVKNANLPEGNMRNASASAKVKHYLCLSEMLIQS